MRVLSVCRSTKNTTKIDGEDTADTARVEQLREISVGVLIHKISDFQCTEKINGRRCCDRRRGGSGCPNCPNILEDMRACMRSMFEDDSLLKHDADDNTRLSLTYERRGRLLRLERGVDREFACTLQFAFPSCDKTGVRVDVTGPGELQPGDYVIKIGGLPIKEAMRKHINTKTRAKYGIIINPDAETDPCKCSECEQLSKENGTQKLERLLIISKPRVFGESRKTRTFRGKSNVKDLIRLAAQFNFKLSENAKVHLDHRHP